MRFVEFFRRALLLHPTSDSHLGYQFELSSKKKGVGELEAINFRNLETFFLRRSLKIADKV
jgi:hypothetical protein